jgi:hypothetical protein
MSDDSWSKRIVLIDGKTLHKHQILLVTNSPDGLCLTASVFAHHGNDIRQVWSVSVMPGGGAICQLPHCLPPTAAATRAGDVMIAVPVRRDGARYDVCDDNTVLTYKPSAAAFVLATEKTVPALELCDPSQQLFDAVSSYVGASDRLAWIAVIRSPSGAPSEIVFEKTQDGPAAIAFSIPQQLWLQAANTKRVALLTLSECMDVAPTPPIERTQLPLTGEQAQALLDKLAKHDAYTDAYAGNCHARPASQCAFTLDGLWFMAVLPGGKAVVWRGVPVVPTIRSGNPTASDWVEQLHILAGDPPPIVNTAPTPPE